MSIINRTKDVSEQKDVVICGNDYSGTATAGIYPVYVAPRAQLLTDAKNMALGLSGAPTMALFLNRFVIGTGAASYAIGGALTVSAFGTSGYQTYSLPATGNSVLALAAGDFITVKAGGSSAALTSNVIELVIQNIQDVRSWF